MNKKRRYKTKIVRQLAERFPDPVPPMEKLIDEEIIRGIEKAISEKKAIEAAEDIVKPVFDRKGDK